VVQIRGGDRLKLRFRELASETSKASSLTVGFLANTTYKSGVPVATVAAIQEFGAPGQNIPPRPFFRTAIERHTDDWRNILRTELKRTRYNSAEALDTLGKVMVSHIQQSIMDLTEPPLSPVTVMLRGMRRRSRYKMWVSFKELMREAVQRVEKGLSNYGASTKPLEDTRLMLRSVAYVVKEHLTLSSDK
jgi:hypothetical protein